MNHNTTYKNHIQKPHLEITKLKLVNQALSLILPLCSILFINIRGKCPISLQIYMLVGTYYVVHTQTKFQLIMMDRNGIISKIAHQYMYEAATFSE